VRPDGEYVLYWMVAHRRPFDNFGLERAAWWAERLGKPMVVLEALRIGYRWASDRIHRFVIECMADNAQAFAKKPVLYYPYLEPASNAGKGLLEAWAARAAVVVTDDFPCFFLPQMLRLAARRLEVKLESVDSNGLLPMRAADKVYERAFSFRGFFHKNFAKHVDAAPLRDPLNVKLPTPPKAPNDIAQRWPMLRFEDAASLDLRAFDIDHSVVPVARTPGGWQAAERRMHAFMDRLDRYEEARNDPDADAGSGLSPYLHFGCISPHRILAEIARRCHWTIAAIRPKSAGKNRDWWGLPTAAESFLDELVTWREIGYNMCHLDERYDQYDSLPAWARKTLEEHATDDRPHLYTLEEFAEARTHDPLWNAAQRQLTREGRIHNYLRMLWGKKILEWTKHPTEALDVLVELNNKYALDGRNPNSYTGIFWTLGRYDRPWGPIRPIFGSIRYMSSDNTKRKVAVKEYMAEYGERTSGGLF
jgi:deoxyribodipyrimidine photo-lyase